MLEIEYEFREQDLLHFNEMQFMKKDEIKQSIRKNRFIVPGLLIIIGFFYYFYYHDLNTMIYILVIAVLWALFSSKMLLADLRRQILRNYSDKEKASMFGTYTLSIDPTDAQYLIEKSPSGKHKMPWSELVRLEYGKRYVYIFVTLDTALVIPVETVKKGNLEQFSEQVEKMIDRYN